MFLPPPPSARKHRSSEDESDLAADDWQSAPVVRMEDIEGGLSTVALDDAPSTRARDVNRNGNGNGRSNSSSSANGITPIGLGLGSAADDVEEVGLNSPVTATGHYGERRTLSPHSASGHGARSSTDSSRHSLSLPRGSPIPTISNVTTSPRLVTSTKFRSVEVPHGSTGSATSSATTIQADPELTPVDEAAPFESIALDADARPPAPIPAQVGHARSQSRSGKRDSWKRESISAKIQEIVHSVPIVGGSHSQPQSAPLSKTHSQTQSQSQSAPGSKSQSTTNLTVQVPERGAGSGANSPDVPGSGALSGSSTPRRHAPPAHPHPFPVPSATTPGSTHVTGPLPVQVSAPGSIPLHGIGVKGVQAREKFMSRTRPQHLPPKSRNEDQEHLHEWEGMMAKSREHEMERRKHDEQKLLEKERHVLAVTPQWESLLNDPDFSVQRVKNNPVSRKLWFEGVPPRLRGQAWSQAIGNPLALNKDVYKVYHRRAQKAHAQNRFPQEVLDRIENDLDMTLRTLHVFHRGSPMRQDLKDLVSAWIVYRSDSARGYAPYITLVAAMFLLVSNPTVAFLSLVNFLSRPTLSAFYNNVQDEIDAFYRVFENLQADMFPRIYANCKNLGLRLPESYFRSALVEQVPFVLACRLWDQIVLEGDAYIFRASLAIFGFLEPRLYFPDREEILSVLEGRNAATNAITERERDRARLRGEQYEETVDGKLSVFGLQEEMLFEWLDNDGWKESRFDRLVTRELPD